MVIRLEGEDARKALNMVAKLAALDIVLAMPEGDGIMFDITPKEVREVYLALTAAAV
jgi:hypothetical protein